MRLLGWLLPLLIGGCGDDGGTPGDAAGTDAARDDAGRADGGNDAAGSDAARVDAGETTCGELGFVGPMDGPVMVDVRPDTDYCAQFRESMTLADDQQRRARLRILPGSYALPAAEGETPFALPVCLQRYDGVILQPEAAGTITYERTVTPEDTYHRYEWAQPLSDGTTTRTLVMQFFSDSARPSPIVVDGSVVNPFGGTMRATLCGATPDCLDVIDALDSCEFDGVPEQVHTVVLSDGTLRFHLRIGMSPAGTEPSAFLRAEGDFRGTPFDVTDYFRLYYAAGHHHGLRSFAFLFDAPVDGACGIEAANAGMDGAYTIDCAVSRLDALTVVSTMHTPPPP